MAATDGSTRVYDAFPPGRRAPRLTHPAARGWMAMVSDYFLDDETLAAGRRFGLRGMLGAIALDAGGVFARTTDLDELAVRLHVAPLTEDSWSALGGHVAQSGGVQARLASGDLPTELLDGSWKSRLLPELDEFSVDCECHQGNLGCVHTVALAAQVGWLLDRDPTALVALRGGSVSALLSAQPPSPGRASPGAEIDDAETDPVEAFRTRRPAPSFDLSGQSVLAPDWLDEGRDRPAVDRLLAHLAERARNAADDLLR